jgi:hypothetical protein
MGCKLGEVGTRSGFYQRLATALNLCRSFCGRAQYALLSKCLLEYYKQKPSVTVCVDSILKGTYRSLESKPTTCEYDSLSVSAGSSSFPE